MSADGGTGQGAATPVGAGSTTVGSLGVEVIAVVCSADRGSKPWLRYMDRVVNQPHDDGRALPKCELSVLTDA